MVFISYPPSTLIGDILTSSFFCYFSSSNNFWFFFSLEKISMICRPGSQEKSIKGWLLEILESVGHRHLVLLITCILTGKKLIYFCSKGYYQNYWVSTNAAVQLQREEVGHKNSCNVEQYHSNRSHIFLQLFFLSVSNYSNAFDTILMI